MAAVLEAALERDPVRSRNTLDDEDELEAQQRRAFMGPLEAEFEVRHPKKGWKANGAQSPYLCKTLE